MLKFLDVLFLLLHLVVVAVNLLGWIWAKTRKAHLVVMAATLLSWIGLGFFYGFGYCFLTDWHWKVKRQLGETDLPASFVKYFTDHYTPFQFSAAIVDWITGISFVLAIIGAIIMQIKNNYR